MRLASILFACSIAAAQVPLTGILNSTIIDQWANLQNITGDTQYSVMTASNYANGSSAGTTTLNLNDGSGNLTLNGKVLVTANDTSAFGNVNCCNVLIYSLDVLDMSNGANLHTSQVNLMSDYGGAQSTNSPAGWYGKVTSGNVTISTGTWKSAPPFTVPGASGSWVCVPVFRQISAGGPAHDSTLTCSPDGGAHWCNPNTYFYRAGGAGCDATNWSATGDAPKCAASAYTAACTDTAYLDATHSSIMWQEPSPYDGSTNLFGNIYCSNFSAGNTATPFGSYIYCYAYRGDRLGGPLLCRVANSIGSVMDPSQYQCYSQSSYTPTNVGSGTSWTTLGSTSGAIHLFDAYDTNGGTLNRTVGLQPWGVVYSSPTYVCNSASTCEVAFTSVPTGYASYIPNVMWLMSAPTPWGPFTLANTINDPGGVASKGLPGLMSWTATAESDGNPFHSRVVFSYDAGWWNPSYGFTIASVTTNDANPTLTIASSAPFPGTWSGNLGITITGSSCAGLNSPSATIAYLSPTTAKVMSGANTTSCSTVATPGQFHGAANGMSQFYQLFDIYQAAPNLGNALRGNSQVRSCQYSQEGCLPGSGQQYYFDFWDHSGNTSYLPLATYDLTRVSGNTQQVYSAAALQPCYAGYFVGCAFPQNSIAWDAYGITHTGSSTAFLSIYDLTATPGAVVNPAMFAGDATWTISVLVKFTNALTENRFLQVGTSSTGVILDTSFYGESTNGEVCAIWNFGSPQYGVCSSSAVLTSGTWYLLTFVRSGTGSLVGAGGSTVKMYVNGVDVGTYHNASYSTPSSHTPAVTAGPLQLGYTGYAAFNGGFASLGIWNRGLTQAEVIRLYGTVKAEVKGRGIILP